MTAQCALTPPSGAQQTDATSGKCTVPGAPRYIKSLGCAACHLRGRAFHAGRWIQRCTPVPGLVCMPLNTLSFPVQ